MLAVRLYAQGGILHQLGWNDELVNQLDLLIILLGFANNINLLTYSKLTIVNSVNFKCNKRLCNVLKRVSLTLHALTLPGTLNTLLIPDIGSPESMPSS